MVATAMVCDLDIREIECDEISSYVQKKQARLMEKDPYEFGDAYTCLGMARTKKLILNYLVGKRDEVATKAFITDLRARLVTIPEIFRESMKQAQESTEFAFDEDGHGVICEAAQGQSAAIKTRIEAARAGGEIVGLFKSGTKVEVLLKAPETQEFLTRLVDLLCPHCAVLLQSELDKTGE
jgi:hypothetical protein